MVLEEEIYVSKDSYGVFSKGGEGAGNRTRERREKRRRENVMERGEAMEGAGKE